MNKQCKICGASVPDDARFCQSCGGSDFVVNNPNANQIDYTQNQYTQPQYSQPQFNQHQYTQPQYNEAQYNQQNPVNSGWQPPAPQKKSKKTARNVIIAIVVFVIMAGLGGLAEKLFQKQENDELSAEHTKGTFDGSVYTNEWANIKFALPEDYSNADSETYSSCEDSTTDCGFYFMNDDSGDEIYALIEEMTSSAALLYDENDYLDIIIDKVEDGFDEYDISFETPDTYSSIIIAEETYVKVDCVIGYLFDEATISFYVRKLGNYMIAISSVGDSAEYNDSLIETITTVD